MTGSEAPRSVAELLGRTDEGWAWFRAAVHDLGEDDWDDPVPGGGWTRRKMLNHIRVWHEITGRRLAQFRETGERPSSPGDEDAINAQAAADADLRSRETILAGLDESFAHLRAAIARLRDDQLTAHDGWPVAVVAGNTYGHYEEHRPDVEAASA
jgi:Mycothiol maleylpyruvate isomerase N-terminal domain